MRARWSGLARCYDAGDLSKTIAKTAHSLANSAMGGVVGTNEGVERVSTLCTVNSEQ
jgi:hypothetical protein